MSTWKWTGTIELGTSGQKFLSGIGDPQGVITAPVGSMYLRTDAVPGASLYMKETGSGNTGWAAVSSGGTSALTIQIAGVPTSLQSVLNVTGTGLTITDGGGGNVNFDVEVTTIPYSAENGTITTVGEALNALLPLTIQNLTNNVLIKEVGSTLASVNTTWTLSDVASDLRFVAIPATFTPNPAILIPSQTAQLFLGAYTAVAPINLTWTLQATKGSQIVTSDTVVSFQLKNYYGADANPTLGSGNIITLTGSSFATNKINTVTYNCAGGKYPYFCYPFGYGDPTQVLVNGIPFTDWTTYTVLFTNASGFSTNYKVVRFNNLQTGILTVSWS